MAIIEREVEAPVWPEAEELSEPAAVSSVSTAAEPMMGAGIFPAAALGAVLGFLGIMAGVAVLALTADVDVVSAIGLGACVGVWGGLGFGAMMGSVIAYVRNEER